MRFTPRTWRYALPPLLLALPAALVSPLLAGGIVALGLAVLGFHRDPERAVGEGIVSPADGTVSVLREEDGRVRVGVFMSPLDVHVNRAPVAGTVESVEHRPGANRPAFSKDSDRNERVRLEYGDVEVALIAGWFARRIHPYVGEGDEVAKGQRIGHISFGSRADVLLPASVPMAAVEVEKGERVRAGETTLVEAAL